MRGQYSPVDQTDAVHGAVHVHLLPEVLAESLEVFGLAPVDQSEVSITMLAANERPVLRCEQPMRGQYSPVDPGRRPVLVPRLRPEHRDRAADLNQSEVSIMI